MDKSLNNVSSSASLRRRRSDENQKDNQTQRHEDTESYAAEQTLFPTLPPLWGRAFLPPPKGGRGVLELEVVFCVFTWRGLLLSALVSLCLLNT